MRNICNIITIPVLIVAGVAEKLLIIIKYVVICKQKAF